MLGQALADASNEEKRQILGSSIAHAGDLSSTVSTLNATPSYGATGSANQVHGSEEASFGDEDEGDSLSDEWSDEDENDVSTPQPALFRRMWNGMKSAAMVVANVENLWDTPPPDPHHTQPRQARHRNHLIVLFWFVILATSYASERSTFKLLVDRSGPFRLFSVEMVTASHALMLGIGMILTRLSASQEEQQQRRQFKSLGIPVVDVGLMALLDTASLLLVFLSGVHVPPTLTVILIQFTLPLTAFLTQFFHPDGRCTFCRTDVATDTQQQYPHRGNTTQSGSNHVRSSMPSTASVGDSTYDSGRVNANIDEETFLSIEERPLPGWGGLSAPHVWGSLIIFLAVALALCPAFYAIADPDFFIYADKIPVRTALNTLLYVSSCIPAAASQLYKEHIFVQYKQPVNMDHLNLLLSIFQFIFASTMSPLVFGLQGLGARGDWTTLYPSAQFSQNFLDGLSCFFGLLDEDDQENRYPEDANCKFSIALVLLHSFSIITVGVAVDKIVNAGATKVMYRGISAGIILAVLCMHAYDMNLPDFNYGPVIDALNLLCLLLLILGTEVYHRVSLQELTFETTYPEVPMLYE